MIKYSKGCSGIHLVFRVTGTSWPHGILPGLFSACIGLVLGLLHDINIVLIDETQFLDNPYPYQLFAYVVGFILVFRTNFGYSRYFDGLDAVQRMGSKWLDGACMAIAFDAKADESGSYLQGSFATSSGHGESNSLDEEKEREEGPDHTHFFEEILHLFSLMHALAFQHLRCDNQLQNLLPSTVPRRIVVPGDSPVRTTSANRMVSGFGAKDSSRPRWCLELPVLGGVSHKETQALERDGSESLRSSLSRIAMVESWIMRRLTCRQKHEPAGDMGKTSPPILSRMVQVISDGHLAFSQAAKVAETPFPFPYHNIIGIFLWLFAVTTPVMVNANLYHGPSRFVVNFVAVWAYFSLAEVGDNLEDPYMPYDPNDLPLEAIHYSFNARLLAFGVVPGSETLQTQHVAPPTSARNDQREDALVQRPSSRWNCPWGVHWLHGFCR